MRDKETKIFKKFDFCSYSPAYLVEITLLAAGAILRRGFGGKEKGLGVLGYQPFVLINVKQSISINVGGEGG